VENRVPPVSLRPASRAGGRPTTDPTYGGGGGRGCQNRARYGSSRQRPASVAGEPKQAISKLAASTADPKSFKDLNCAAYTAADDDCTALPGPTHSHSGFEHRCLITPGLTLGATGYHGPCQDDGPPVQRCARPGMTAASEPRVHQTVNPGTRISSTRTPARCGRTPRPSPPSLPLIRRARFDRPDEGRRAAIAGLSLAR
jgi:hypothetical protein